MCVLPVETTQGVESSQQIQSPERYSLGVGTLGTVLPQPNDLCSLPARHGDACVNAFEAGANGQADRVHVGVREPVPDDRADVCVQARYYPLRLFRQHRPFRLSRRHPDCLCSLLCLAVPVSLSGTMNQSRLVGKPYPYPSFRGTCLHH